MQRYTGLASEIKAYGLNVEKSHQKKENNKYLKQLRVLQKEYDTLALLLQKELVQTIAKDEYKTFSIMLSSDAQLFFQKKKLKEEVYAYYRKQHNRGAIIPLQQRIKKDKNIIEVYSPRPESHANYNTHHSKKRSQSATQNSVTILSTPTCPYCVKAKRYLRSKGIAFKDYNINSSSEGKRLYKQYNGNGVPVVIINGTVIRGYSEQAMRSALR